jgi:hypothetical protein
MKKWLWIAAFAVLFVLPAVYATGNTFLNPVTVVPPATIWSAVSAGCCD